MEIKDCVILITGACGDIGRETALAFGKRGGTIILNDIVAEDQARPIMDAIHSAGGKSEYFCADVRDRRAVDRMVGAGVEKFGRLDVTIGNAAIFEQRPFLELDPESWTRQLDVNLTGNFHIAQASARVMVGARRQGKIIFISSWAQEVPWSGISAYCVSKSGLKLLAKCMALELARSGIRVNLVAPGFVDGGLSGQALRANPDLKAKCENMVPLGYLASPADVAAAVLLLCSPGAEYMTGSTLLVDGGNSLFFRA